MISIVITAFKEPETIGRAIESIISQPIKQNYELIIACPDQETKNVVEAFAYTNPKIKHFQDPGQGKSYALNQLFTILKGDILIFTDGDVFVGSESIGHIVEAFEDPKVGCITGRVVSQNSRKQMFGYWSHLLADAGAHRIRKKLHKQNKFLECSGYLFAFRNHVVKSIPLDVAEDSIIPYYFFKKGYKVAYVPKARVYVKNPNNFKDWLQQRKRTAGAHSKLTKYEPNMPKVKSFTNEILEGGLIMWKYPKNLKEFYWTILLGFGRLYMWAALFFDEKIRGSHYGDGWQRVESTK
jgi:cellulose synthase/poly-beta-1,6-N-acetylglucosamine synthase-like glycosyltransferase